MICEDVKVDFNFPLTVEEGHQFSEIDTVLKFKTKFYGMKYPLIYKRETCIVCMIIRTIVTNMDGSIVSKTFNTNGWGIKSGWIKNEKR